MTVKHCDSLLRKLSIVLSERNGKDAQGHFALLFASKSGGFHINNTGNQAKRMPRDDTRHASNAN